ncbi:transposase [Candidatus Gracilibacteria bacterium]|nr:transposase [Candidatus Gracilibacteria bacterium]
MPQLFANKYRTQSIRLPERDYSSGGGYFCTICVDKHQRLLGEIIDGKINLSEIGKIVEQCRFDITNHFPNIELDEYVIMPNHIHGILFLHEKNNQPVETHYSVSPNNETRHGMSLHKINQFGKMHKNSISLIINQFKGSVTRQTNKLNLNFHRQSGFYEHVIRNNQDLQRIQEYIQNNTCKRQNDEYYIS